MCWTRPDELSALIPAIVAQRHQDGDTVPMLETADWLAPLDPVALLGATVNLLDRARRCCASGRPTPRPITCVWSRADQAEPPAAEHPQH